MYINIDSFKNSHGNFFIYFAFAVFYFGFLYLTRYKNNSNYAHITLSCLDGEKIGSNDYLIKVSDIPSF